MTSVVAAGDILIKHYHDGKVGKLISFGQKVSKGDKKFVHACIASSPFTVIEMSGQGMHEENLTTENAAYKYELFRCTNDNLAEGAAETAKMIMGFQKAKTGKIDYTMKGAVKSLFKNVEVKNKNRVNAILDNLLSGGTESYFCSGHVVLCYIIAMEQTGLSPQSSFPLQKMQSVFGLEFTGYNPSYLDQHLRKNSNFDYKGTIKQAKFLSI